MKNKIILFALFLLSTSQLHAQFIKERSIEASIGIGYNFPNDDIDLDGSGFFFARRICFKNRFMD